MEAAELQRRLRECPVLAGLPDAAIADAAAEARVVNVRAGAMIYEKGLQYSVLTVIAGGSVRISSVSSSGQESMLMVLDAGSWFGDNVFSPGVPRVYGAIAHEDSQLVEVPGRVLRELLQRYPQAYPVVLDLISRRLFAAMALIEDDALRSVEARCGRRLLFLLKFKGIEEDSEQPVRFQLTREHIANMLGMTRQGVHKVIKGFEQAGLIQLEYGGITLCNPRRLKDYLEALS